ncbi:MAG: hypothetical protein KAT66_00320 [Candidatus Lokiarchaeota archaeon]|nr:hypothetical protein [Candidatus Lokiarchaeota archaeon]
MQKISDNYVRMAKCRFCGKENGEILINKYFREIKEEEAYSPNPCKECEKRFKTYKFFIGNCGHSGFIKISALKDILTKEALKELKEKKIFRLEKCFACMSNTDINKFEKI